MENTKLILQDVAELWQGLLPLTYTKPISHVRIGIDTIKEKWEAAFQLTAQIDTEEYLLPKFKNPQGHEEHTLVINSACIPNQELISAIKNLQPQQTLSKDNFFIARFTSNENLPVEEVNYVGKIDYISRPWHLFLLNDKIFKADFDRITANRDSQDIPNTNQTKNKEHIFLEAGAEVEFSILDATKGPIYLGKNAKILAGCMVQGGLALCDSAVLKMGTKHYGTSTIGPHSKVGGEVGNVVIQAYSNKGHDGYLGNAVIGEWCNLGADTNSSNLKNNYGLVSAYSYLEGKSIETHEQFVGLMMGDHSKCAINTMFNTATVVGVAANIFGAGFPRTHVPSFVWGGVTKNFTFKLEKAFEMAESMMKRRNVPFTDLDKDIFKHIFTVTEKFRTS